MATVERDCRVLESFKIMDYSLLLGTHNLDQAKIGEMQLEREGICRTRRGISRG